MNKTLLLSASMILMASSAFGVSKDPATYAPAEGLVCENVWLTSLYTDKDDYMGLGFVETNKARSATVAGSEVVVGYSEIPEGSEEELGMIARFDLATGKLIKKVQLTCDGSAITGLLCVNTIGTDDFGHVWFAGVIFDSAAKPIKLYYIKDLETGECALAGDLQVPEEEASDAGRHDYGDLVGDVTREKARCVYMTALACPSTDTTGTKTWDKTVMGWECEQGSDTWGPHMNDGDYYCGIMEESYPEGAVNWNGAPVVSICRDEDFSGETFYVDPFNGYPTLYNQAGALLDSMEAAPDMLGDEGLKSGANGVTEIKVAGVDLLAMALCDYNTDPGCRIVVARFGENLAFEGMHPLWVLPKDAFGNKGDGGSRIMPIKAVVAKDANGKEGAYLMAYKSQNGFGVWRIAEEGWEDTIGGAGVVGIEADASDAPVHYFNLQGQRVNADDLQAGLYITRQGAKTQKVIIK